MSKYRNRKTVVDGITFDSAAEARRWEVLRMLERTGAVSGLERAVSFPLYVHCVEVGRYVADFVYFWPNRDRVIEDVKGVQTAVFRLKARIMAAQGMPVTIYKGGKSTLLDFQPKRKKGKE